MISRRDFLKALLYTGAITALPFDISEASEPQIEKAWSVLRTDPVVFDVEDRTIYAPWAEYPRTYGDLFDDSTDFSSRAELIKVYDEHFDLQSHFYDAFEDAASVEQSLACKLQDRLGMDDGLIAWLNKAPLEDLAAIVDGWLSSELPCCYEMPLQKGPMGEAYGYFLQQDREMLKALGVVVIEGEHPGSSYFAAELRVPVDDANYVAAALDIPIRFKGDS